MPSAAIEFENLTRDFGARRAVDGVSLRVEPGEIVGFLGPNGAGKTTAIRCLLGLAKPTSGSARIFGSEAARDRAQALRGVGSLVEGAALFDHLSARDHLRAAAFYVGEPAPNAQIEDCLQRVGLADRAGDRASTFSRGMKQRLALATALLGDPRLLVLDEPTDGLDPLGTVEIRKLLKALRDKGATIFLSSHLLPEVEAICDRIAILDKGKLRAFGAISQLKGDQSLEEFFLGVVAPGSLESES
jgi:ABC-2 type transport system ATP-binding protein